MSLLLLFLELLMLKSFEFLFSERLSDAWNSQLFIDHPGVFVYVDILAVLVVGIAV
jgi:hypothetical protein